MASSIRQAGASIATPRDKSAHRATVTSHLERSHLERSHNEEISKRLTVAHVEIAKLHEDADQLKKQEIEINLLRNAAARSELSVKAKCDQLEIALERSNTSLKHAERNAHARQEDSENKIIALQTKLRQTTARSEEAKATADALRKQIQMELIETKRLSALAKTGDAKKYRELELRLEWAEQATVQANASAAAQLQEAEARQAAMQALQTKMQEQVACAEDAVFEMRKELLASEEQLQSSVIEAQHSAGSSEAGSQARFQKMEVELERTKRRADHIDESTAAQKLEQKTRLAALTDDLAICKSELAQWRSAAGHSDLSAATQVQQLNDRLQRRLKESDETAERLRKDVRDVKAEFLDWQRGDSMFKANAKAESTRLESMVKRYEQAFELSESNAATERQHLELKFTSYQRQEEDASRRAFDALQQSEANLHELRGAEINAQRISADEVLSIVGKLQNLEANHERFKGETAQAEVTREMTYTATQEKLEAQLMALEAKEEHESATAAKLETRVEEMVQHLQKGRNELEEQLQQTCIDATHDAALAKVDASAQCQHLEHALRRAEKLNKYQEESNLAAQKALEAQVMTAIEDAAQCRREREQTEVTLMQRCQEITKRLKLSDSRANDSNLRTVQVEADSEACQLELEAALERSQSTAQHEVATVTTKYEDLELQLASSEKRAAMQLAQAEIDMDQLQKETLATSEAAQETEEEALSRMQKAVSHLYEEEQDVLSMQQEEVAMAAKFHHLESEVASKDLSIDALEENVASLTSVTGQLRDRLQQTRLKANKGAGKGPKKLSAAREDRLWRIFKMCERSGDGKITRKELAHICKKNKGIADFFRLPAHDTEAIDVFFLATDSDNSGDLSWDELKDWAANGMN